MGSPGERMWDQVMRSVQLKLRLRLGEKLTRSDGCFFDMSKPVKTMSLQVEWQDRNVPDPVRFQPGRTFVDLLLVLAFRIAVTVQRRQVLKRSRIFADIAKRWGEKSARSC
jgi:hypothetical protein